MIVKGTQGLLYTIGRSSLLTLDTLRRLQGNNNKNMIPKAQHCFCIMVLNVIPCAL